MSKAEEPVDISIRVNVCRCQPPDTVIAQPYLKFFSLYRRHRGPHFTIKAFIRGVEEEHFVADEIFFIDGKRDYGGGGGGRGGAGGKEKEEGKGDGEQGGDLFFILCHVLREERDEVFVCFRLASIRRRIRIHMILSAYGRQKQLR